MQENIKGYEMKIKELEKNIETNAAGAANAEVR
jgi:hypothetical protein